MFASMSLPQAVPVPSPQDPSQVPSQHLKFLVLSVVQMRALQDPSEIPRHFVLNCVPLVAQQTASQVGTQVLEFKKDMSMKFIIEKIIVMLTGKVQEAGKPTCVFNVFIQDKCFSI
jgi:hypothetical protein